jgi:beta-lactamase class A
MKGKITAGLRKGPLSSALARYDWRTCRADSGGTMRRIWVLSLVCLLANVGCQATPAQQRSLGPLTATRLPTVTRATKAAWFTAGRLPVVGTQHANREPLREAVRRYMAGRPGRAGVMISDLRTGAAFGYRQRNHFATASVIKVNILAGLLLERQDEHRGLTGSERALAERMIRFSDNEAANVMYSLVGGGHGLNRVNRRLGVRHTVPVRREWGVSLTCAADQVGLLRALVTPASPLSSPNRQYVLRLMSEVSPNQAWGISAATHVGDRFSIKDGWVPLSDEDEGWAVNSIGLIRAPGHDFLLAVLSDDQPSLDEGIKTVEQLSRLATSALRG